MKKLTQLVLMLCLVLSGAWCYAGGVDGTGNEKGNDGTSILVIERTSHSSSEKGVIVNAIDASIDGHYLTVAFTENLGQVAIEITTASGGYVETLSITTPNGLQFYIPNTCISEAFVGIDNRFFDTPFWYY